MQNNIKRVIEGIGRLSSSFNFIGKYFLRREREDFEGHLRGLPSNSRSLIQGSVLLDGTFDNPNFWFRTILLLKALGVNEPDKLIGLLGPYRANEQANTLRGMGAHFFEEMIPMPSNSSKKLSNEMWAALESPDEILKWDLPEGIPAGLLYDHILKRQKSETVKIKEPKGRKCVEEFISAASSAKKFFTAEKPALFIASHAVGVSSAWVWIALQHGVRVIVPFGYDGLCRFWSLSQVTDIFDFGHLLNPHSFKSLPKKQQEYFECQGEKRLSMRFEGLAKDIGAVHAYDKKVEKPTKEMICQKHGWSKEKPIVGFFSSNWHDYPHAFGMKRFRDHFDFAQTVLGVAKKAKRFNWLIKGHPLDNFYGSQAIEKLFHDAECDHIKFSNQPCLFNAIDAAVTCHGTIGVEAVAMGRPVLVGDRGWYDDMGFVLKADNKKHFIELLGTEWWSDGDREENARLARRFAGILWGIPENQGEFFLEDDSKQWELYGKNISLIKNHGGPIEVEMEKIRQWYHSQAPNYHVHKVMNTFNL